MISNEFGIVWLKRDLRLTDHLPLLDAMKWAQQKGADLFFLYLVEPRLISQPDCAPQHYNFALECLEELAVELPADSEILFVHSDAIEFFDTLISLGISFTLFSHEETGNWASFQRDKKLKGCLKDAHVNWIEYPSNGVVRGPLNRDNWSNKWAARMQRDIYDSMPRYDWHPTIGKQTKVLLSKTLIQKQLSFTWLNSQTSLPKEVLCRANQATIDKMRMKPTWHAF